jgi:hypothetical protein
LGEPDTRVPYEDTPPREVTVLEDIHPTAVARIRLEAWRDTAGWLDYAAAEFIPDQSTRGYLEHVAECIRDESERRYAAQAGFDPAVT